MDTEKIYDNADSLRRRITRRREKDGDTDSKVRDAPMNIYAGSFFRAQTLYEGF